MAKAIVACFLMLQYLMWGVHAFRDAEMTSELFNSKGALSTESIMAVTSTRNRVNRSAGLFEELLTGLWPQIDESIWSIVNTVVNPMLAEKLPGPLSDLQIRKFSLGRTAPKLAPESVEDLDDGLKLVVRLDMQLNTDISLANSGGQLTLGVSGLSLRGDVVVLLTPLIGEMPVVGGWQLYFIDTPDIKLHFSDAAKTIAELPLVRSILPSVISRVVARFLVLPNVLGGAIASPQQGVSPARYGQPNPVGVLVTAPRRAEGLENKGWYFLGRQSHPYVHIQVGEQQWATSVVENTQSPRWSGESHFFPVFDRQQRVELSVYHRGLAFDTKLGESSPMTVHESLQQLRHSEKTFQLHAADTEAATLTMSLEWLFFVPFKLEHTSGMMEVSIYSLNLLSSLNVETAAVKVSFAGLSRTTAFGYKPAIPWATARVLTPVVERCIKKAMPLSEIADITGLSETQVGELSGTEVESTHFPLTVNTIMYFPFQQSMQSYMASFEVVDLKGNVLAEGSMNLKRMLQRPQTPYVGPIRFHHDEGDMQASGKFAVFGLNDGWSMADSELWAAYS